jgi:phosphatidylglycerophosphate synthase
MMVLGDSGWRLAAVPLLLLGLLLDTLDGYVARKTQMTSFVGSVLDIAADRAYELVLWVTFVSLHLIPVAIPIIVILRTTLTDAFRSIGAREGIPPLDQVKSGVGRFLVRSPWMRTLYGLSKILAFCGLGLTLAFSSYPEGSILQSYGIPIAQVSVIVAWIAVVVCVLRGLPVIIDARRFRQLEMVSEGEE